MQNNKMNGSDKNTTIIVAVITLIIGVLIGYLIWGMSSSQDVLVETNDDPANEEADVFSLNDSEVIEDVSMTEVIETQGSGGESISVSNQRAGNTVLVDSVSVDAISWIAVRDLSNGQIGNILGAQRVSAGEYTNLEVQLIRSTEKGGNYAVVIFEDNGDLEFDNNTDSLVMADESIVLDSFEIIENLEVTIE